jgi:hypothetical protein
VHLTLTGSSWLNQVERYFALLTDKNIRRGAEDSQEDGKRHDLRRRSAAIRTLAASSRST